MDKFIITGGSPLVGEITLGGAKNVALKATVASLLTDEEVVIRNVPDITDVHLMLEVIRSLGKKVKFAGHVVHISNGHLLSHKVPLDIGARLRTSSMVLGPLLLRLGKAQIPNPGGCRIGARPIDRHIEGLTHMGATIIYDSSDGYFYAKANKIHGARYSFPKNTHTGTETLILAGVLAKGQTVLENAAQEVEIDNLILLLTAMGADIKRTKPREITINGVSVLKGADFTIMPDRNEEVTFAIAAAMTNGKIVIHDSRRDNLTAFLDLFSKAGGKYEILGAQTTRYMRGDKIIPTDVITAPHPGFMTDWQAPWAVFMTQAHGTSTIHETVFESRFSYVKELQKMGATMEFFDSEIGDPERFYNFNWSDRKKDSYQGIRIHGPVALHNAVLEINDLRAGATLVLAALASSGESYIHGVDQIDRGYEAIELKLRHLGAKIKRTYVE